MASPLRPRTSPAATWMSSILSASQFRSSRDRSAKLALVFRSRMILSICSGVLAGLVISHRSEILMNELHSIGTFAYARGDAFDGAAANIPGDEDARDAGFEEPGLAL